MRAMKDSGVEWIGKIPEVWDIVQARRYVSVNHGSDPKTPGSIPVYGSGSISFKTCGEYKEGPTVLLGRKGTLNAPQYITGKYWNVDTAFDVAITDDIALRFYYYLATCFDYMYYSSQTAVPSMTQSNYLSMRLPVPHINVQNCIVNLLNTKCVEIDKVVEQTRATIEEYKKLKQAIITEAVTKGVRGPRPMKPSGVEWIGDIPAEWHKSRVGLHYHVVLGKMLCNTQQTDDYTLEPYYCAADIHFGSVDAAKKEMWFSPEEKDTYRVMPGDLLVVEGGAGAGGCAIVKTCETATYIQNSIMIVRGKSTCSVAYLGYWIESLVKRAYIDIVCNKATIPHFTKDKLSSVPVPLPSSDEQQEIATYLDTKCAEVDRIIEKKEQLIEELGSYKKSLIYEYVTGKKEIKIHNYS